MSSRKNSKSIEMFTDVCSICLEDFNTEKEISKILPCSHIFCQKCLENWLTIKKTCPQCCQAIQEINVLQQNKVIAQHKIEQDQEEESKLQDQNEIGKEFFKEQFSIQLNRIKFIKNKLSQDFKSNLELKWMFIFEIEDEIRASLRQVESDQSFNKKAQVEVVFRIEEILTKIETNNWNFIDFSKFEQEQEQSNIFYPISTSQNKKYKNFFQDNNDFFGLDDDEENDNNDDDEDINNEEEVKQQNQIKESQSKKSKINVNQQLQREVQLENLQFINNFTIVQKKANNSKKSKKHRKTKQQKQQQ